MKKLFLILLFATSLTEPVSACVCAEQLFVDRYALSDFVAKVRINKRLDDTVYITVIDLFKGEAVSKLHVSGRGTSCQIDIEENTTWLIFASRSKNGVLGTGLCSGPEQIDGRNIDEAKYPGLKQRIYDDMQFKMNLLAFLRDKKIRMVYTDGAVHSLYKRLMEIRGFEISGKQFAVYEISVDKDRVITSLKAIKPFTNDELSKRIATGLKDAVLVPRRSNNNLSLEGMIHVVFYTYPSEQGYKSFIGVDML